MTLWRSEGSKDSMQCFSCWVCLPPAPVEGKGLVPELWAPGKAPHLPLVSPMAPLHPNPLQWPSRCCPRCPSVLSQCSHLKQRSWSRGPPGWEFPGRATSTPTALTARSLRGEDCWRVPLPGALPVPSVWVCRSTGARGAVRMCSRDLGWPRTWDWPDPVVPTA